MSEPWTDEEFLGYVDLHSRTELALFHRDHVKRLCELSGAQWVGRMRDFEPLHYHDIKPALEEARVRLATQQPATRGEE